MRYFIFTLCFCSLLMSCQHSPKKNYFYLSPLTNTENTISVKTNISQVIGIGPIEIADYLTRSQIIDNQTDNTLNMADNAYWAEPLDKSVARVTALNLTQLNPSRSFVNFPWRADTKPHFSLRLRIDNLARAEGKATINATWDLINNDTKANLVRRNFIRTLPAGSGAKALAQAYSQLLADLAKEMDIELNNAK